MLETSKEPGRLDLERERGNLLRAALARSDLRLAALQHLETFQELSRPLKAVRPRPGAAVSLLKTPHRLLRPEAELSIQLANRRISRRSILSHHPSIQSLNRLTLLHPTRSRPLLSRPLLSRPLLSQLLPRRLRP